MKTLLYFNLLTTETPELKKIITLFAVKKIMKILNEKLFILAVRQDGQLVTINI